MNKFNAKRVKTADGTFDSKREYKMWLDLKDTQEKGLYMMISFITILVICQILPLAFAIVVKFGRG